MVLKLEQEELQAQLNTGKAGDHSQLISSPLFSIEMWTFKFWLLNWMSILIPKFLKYIVKMGKNYYSKWMIFANWIILSPWGWWYSVKYIRLNLLYRKPIVHRATSGIYGNGSDTGNQVPLEKNTGNTEAGNPRAR